MSNRHISRLLCLPYIFFAGFSLLANGQGVEGRVINCNDSQPLAGVSVRIAGTRMGTATGDDGWYSFPKLKKGSYVLVFSFVGMSCSG